MHSKGVGKGGGYIQKRMTSEGEEERLGELSSPYIWEYMYR